MPELKRYLPYPRLNHGRSIRLLDLAALAVFVCLLTLHPSAAGRVYAEHLGMGIIVLGQRPALVRFKIR